MKEKPTTEGSVNNMNTNEVIEFYEAMRKKWPNPAPEWNQLDPGRQMILIQAINMILQVLP